MKAMGILKDKRKFKRKVHQSNPANPTGNVDIDNNKFDIGRETIKEHKTKE